MSKSSITQRIVDGFRHKIEFYKRELANPLLSAGIRLEYSVMLPQIKAELYHQERKLARENGEKRYRIKNSENQYYHYDEGMYFWDSEATGAISLSQIQIERLCIINFGSDFQEKGIKIQFHY